ncbi:uncharacterized protein LOC143362429 [Halictus rubicundus]|uniref:uncharacterized protein LOC143362429 n=1 Tax=Halictus rubicundus TaxID=77578 RepID=UPI004036027B
MADTMKRLVRQRGSHKAQLTRLVNNVRSFDDAEDVDMLDQFQRRLEEISSNFAATQLEIESLEDNLDNEDIRQEFEGNYFECSREIRKIRRTLRPPGINANNPTNSNTAVPFNINTQSILPKIQIKPFDGNLAEWNSFRDMFTDLVHNNNSLPIVHKFHLLKSYLRGDALVIIESLNSTEENYVVAWNLLQRRFNNPRKIIQAHIRALFELPQIHSHNLQILRTLTDKVEMHINALRALEQPVDWHEMLIYIVTAKLDKHTRLQWERSVDEDRMPTIQDLIKFLNKFARDAEPLHLTNCRPSSLPRDGMQVARYVERPRQVHVTVRPQVNCPVCTKGHYIQYCEQFLQLKPQDRVAELRKHKLCHNCLRPDHSTIQCRSGNCRQCNKKHNTLLHFEPSNTERATVSNSVASSTNTVSLLSLAQSEPLLATARVIIYNRENKENQCRALLDSCSQSNFMTETLAKSLKLKLHNLSLPVSGFGEQQSQARYYAKTKFKSRTSNFTEEVAFIVVPKITSQLPSYQIDRSGIPIPNHLKLADPEFHVPASIDILLGEYLYYKLLGRNQIRLPNGKGVIQKTGLGWVISGQVELKPTKREKTVCHITNHALSEQLTKFWDLEECEPRRHLSAEDKQCEQYFATTTTRDEQGRYIVRLPFNNKTEMLGETYNRALKRFQALERRLQIDSNLKQQYKEFIDEYRKLGHMSAAKQTTNCDGFYLPHHAVIKTTSNTTKLRVVFDGSAKPTSGLSLNDTLLVGPTIQDDLFQLVVRFRVHQYVLTADIEKMFRQIKIHPEDTKFQKILWRDNPNEPIKTFTLDTVTYGTASAPFLAVRALKQLARDEGHSYPLAAAALENDFYMDDLLTGANTIEQAEKLRDDLQLLLSLGGFNLRQWASNQPSLTKHLDPASDTIHFNASETKKTLGICWNAKTDTITYNVNHIHNTDRVTKRDILSKTAQLFDPLGLLGPVIIIAKFIMQDMWKLKLDWDESVPQYIHTAWIDFLSQLPNLNNFNVQRNIMVPNPVRLQLHGFSDASERGYGACIYIRSENEEGRVETHLLSAKSKVAPLKSVTLPRLELCAATLLVQLYKSISNTLKLKFDKIKLWTDSTITLHWINTSPHLLKTFVANRVAEIQSHTEPHDWSHVISSDNPADFISRGQVASQFIHNHNWLHGPAWLVQPEASWPHNPILPIEIPEQRTTVVLIANTDNKTQLFDKFSSFSRLLRVVAYCLRFRSKYTGELSITELRQSHNRIIKSIQAQQFNKELKQLTQGIAIDKSSKLTSLNPFIDSDGIMRVGGRLRHAKIKYGQKHPILLPKSNRITSLILQQEHVNNMHAGVQGTLYSVRQRYWPIDGKNTTRFIIRKCIRCFKANPRNSPDYLMADLPKDRVIPARPFENVGIDYCGPLFVKEKRFRNQKRLKVYVAVFVCFLTKAVHLELASDLTTEAFLAAFKRFSSRRGKPKNVYSDNGTNFIGAKNLLSELFNSQNYKKQIQQYLTSQAVEWHLSPPQSPHFGGLWEAAVKSFKHHLIRTVGDTLLTYEQLNTYVIEIEGILNSRPLTPLSPDPNDLQTLTPAHFLIGESLTSLPEQNLSGTPSNRLSLWQHTQQMKQHFWARWHKEYLNEINIRTKWKQGGSNNLRVNDLVLIRDEGLPSMRWPIGRVLEVHPGGDNVVRVVTVKSASGIYKRSIKKICPLPIDLV